ncbi:putative mitochondrial tricarboxylate transporter [Aspergillus ambiguus]|uniref:putative mitochondrial tricarboxylate transporter (Ctp) n=1 Tax=Aspergillus ambiguus TaxID=176160 RepID=UPI003CCCF9C3
MASTTQKDQKQKPSTLRSIIAGSTAGAIEIAITYPAEFAKTRSQLNRKLPDGQKLPWPPFGKQWYAGCTTLIIGNSLKAGIRFVAFDTFKSLLQDENGKISGPRTVVAGFGAGFTESLLAVTPFESIKTQLIDDRKSANPRMRGFLHGSKVIFQERGVRGFFQGFVPTTARQAANSAVRFSSYTTIKQFAQGYVAPGEKLGTVSTFAIGGMAGLITVYATQPLDTVKTRMQSLEASKNYKNSFVCAARIVKDEGIFTLWSGAVPRLARLIMSGGIVFTMYEKTMDILDSVDPERKYL